MRIIADLHTHSRYAMACSSNITLQGMDETARQKGINLLSTGDFTHPRWLEEIKSSLEPSEPGLFKLKGSDGAVRFILGTEVSTVFSGSDNSSKRIHNCILMPGLESAEALNEALSKKGDLSSDGRPQVSMSAAELVELVMSTDKNAFVFPAHAWTPFFGALGATGFNSIKDAYQDQEKHIHALETGLSSDPVMNWRLSALDKYALLSNSDMHSLPKMGRELNVFEFGEGNVSYCSLMGAIKEKDKKHFKKTLEFFPEEGKYHFDGHRQCMVSVDPQKDKITLCPVCGKKLVVGVVHRIDSLADREPGYVPSGAIPYMSAVPLREVIAYTLRKGETSVAVEKMYEKMISGIGPEFDILVDANLDRIGECGSADIETAIRNVREGRINVVPGYAGVFGKVDLLNREGRGTAASTGWKQKTLGGFKKPD